MLIHVCTYCQKFHISHNQKGTHWISHNCPSCGQLCDNLEDVIRDADNTGKVKLNISPKGNQMFLKIRDTGKKERLCQDQKE